MEECDVTRRDATHKGFTRKVAETRDLEILPIG